MKLAFIYLCLTSLILSSALKSNAQAFDSVVLYAVNMNGSYYVKIDKELIKNQSEMPYVVTEINSIKSIKSLLCDSVCGSRIKKLKSNNIDIRLSFEFFSHGKLKKVIGVSSYGTMFIDNILYSSESKYLFQLENYIPGISNVMGITR